MADPGNAPDKEGEKKIDKPEPKPAGRAAKLLVPALLVLDTVLLIAVLAVLLLRPLPGARSAARSDAAPEGTPEPTDHKSAETASEKNDAGRAPGPTLRLPDFVVHLRDPDADRYARMAFELEVSSEIDKEKIQAHLPRIRDAFLAFLSDRSAEELRGSEGVSRVKQALLDKLKDLVPGVPVRALYITDLVIQ